MTKGILVSCTYQIVTPESAADGDFAETGFEWENREFIFRELVDLLSECYEWSNSAPYNEATWGCVEPYTSNYETGEERSESYHYSRDNEARMAKYWRKAIEYVEAGKKARRERLWRDCQWSGDGVGERTVGKIVALEGDSQ
ncbi:MAG: hypothetical protein ACREA4_08305 [Nitrososphaera sp.]